MKRLICLTISFLPVFSNSTFAMKKRAIKKRTKVLFAHGFGEDGDQGLDYKVDYNMFPHCDLGIFDFPDSPRAYENGGKLNCKKTNFAQGQEIETLEDSYRRVEDKHNKVVAGVSRGAMCVLSADCPGALCRFAESPAASLKDVIDHQCKQFGFGWVPCLGRFIHRWLIRPIKFKNYDPKGDKPIDKVKNIPRNQPVFIAYTTKDALIPASSSVKLAEELVKTGHNDVYLYGTDVGSHSDIANSDGDFVNVSSAFLKCCGAIPRRYKCKKGDQILAECKIDNLDQVRILRKKLEWDNWKNYWKRNSAVFLIFTAAVVSAIYFGKKLMKRRALSKVITKKTKDLSLFSRLFSRPRG